MKHDDVDHLPKATLEFLRELSENNSKAWFEARRKRYQDDVVEPVRSFVRAIGARLPGLSSHLAADDRKSGGSMTRIHRDVRFSKDKSPYNAHVGLHFWHRAGDKGRVPGFFLRIAPSGVLVATGLHMPDGPQLDRVRRRIAEKSSAWRKAVDDPAFVRAWGRLEGERLKRPPQGFDPSHPAVEDLKLKDFAAFAELPATDAARTGFADRLAERWQASAPLMRFLCAALDLPY